MHQINRRNVKLNGNKPDIEEDNDYKDIGKIEPTKK